MPLDRRHVTVAQRVMIPVNTAAATLFALAYLTTADRLREAPTYAAIDKIIPLFFQGIGYACIALILFAGMWTKKRELFVAGLAWMMSWTVILSGMLVYAWYQHQVTILAWVFPAYMSAACWASMLSLITREKS